MIMTSRKPCSKGEEKWVNFVEESLEGSSLLTRIHLPEERCDNLPPFWKPQVERRDEKPFGTVDSKII